jgi:hypothetical protein
VGGSTFAPQALQPGDQLVTPDNHIWNVKFVDGPDRIGTFDVGLIDDQGNSKFEILNNPVRIIM